MISRTPTPAEWPYGMVRLPCGLCPRRGQYRKGTLIRRFGADEKMPDLRYLIRSLHVTTRQSVAQRVGGGCVLQVVAYQRGGGVAHDQAVRDHKIIAPHDTRDTLHRSSMPRGRARRCHTCKRPRATYPVLRMFRRRANSRAGIRRHLDIWSRAAGGAGLVRLTWRREHAPGSSKRK
jgi:hypothetical protein